MEIESFIRLLNSFLVCDAADLNAATAILWKSEKQVSDVNVPWNYQGEFDKIKFIQVGLSGFLWTIG